MSRIIFSRRDLASATLTPLACKVLSFSCNNTADCLIPCARFGDVRGVNWPVRKVPPAIRASRARSKEIRWRSTSVVSCLASVSSLAASWFVASPKSFLNLCFWFSSKLASLIRCSTASCLISCCSILLSNLSRCLNAANEPN